MIIRARSPLRIGFGGGGTDVAPYYHENGGAVLNATINRYAFVTLEPGGKTIKINSLDYDSSFEYGIDDPFIYEGQLDLVGTVLDYHREKGLIAEGIKITLHNDAPPGSGLGSSSAMVISLLAALDAWLNLGQDSYELAELAVHLERNVAAQAGGKQDQFASAFGGFNFIEFQAEDTVVHPLRIPPPILKELEYRIVLAYVGGTRFSSKIIEKQVRNYREGREFSVSAMKQMKNFAYEMRKSLLLGKLSDFSQLIHESWAVKKNLADGISTDEIDAIYMKAQAAGAIGGKVSGAGGGGFMFFICNSESRANVQNVLRICGATVVNFNFEQDGVRTWTLQSGI